MRSESCSLLHFGRQPFVRTDRTEIHSRIGVLILATTAIKLEDGKEQQTGVGEYTEMEREL